jgi:hypothetical protein
MLPKSRQNNAIRYNKERHAQFPRRLQSHGDYKKMLRRQMSLEHLQIKYPAPWTGKPDIGVVITD